MRSQKYGAKNRKLVDAAIQSQKKKYECKRCGKKKVRRIGFSVWKCRSCSSVFAGGAYALSTEAGEIAVRSIEEYSKNT